LVAGMRPHAVLDVPNARHVKGVQADRARHGQRESGSHMTRRWREMDSNPQSHVRATFFSNPLIKWKRAAHNELCDRRNDQMLDSARFK
jgi:hypothetical protein